MAPSTAPQPIRRPFASRRLAGYAMLLLLVIGAVQVLASILFYDAIDRHSVREDHARRVAELLVVSDRVHRVDPAITARVMSTHHLQVVTGQKPAVLRSGSSDIIVEIRDHILLWEPMLAERMLTLSIERGTLGYRDLVGSMRLNDGTWLNFRSRDISSGWPIALRATLMTLAITLVCIGAGLIALRFLTNPLRRLTEAAEALGHGEIVPVQESGPADLRDLARSFNDMQARIAGLVTDQARSFEAISHDLRTPLSRLKVAADFVAEGDIARIVASSADEMEGLLMSLQRFLRAQHLTSQPEPMDLVPALRDMAAPFADRVTVTAPASAMVTTWREPLLLALQPLLDNALHYGDAVAIILSSAGEDWRILISDNGPGLDDAYFEQILDPFFRLDSARTRDTAGFGLGIPTAHRLLQRFGGALEFGHARQGGLVAIVTVPKLRDDAKTPDSKVNG